MKFNLLQAAPEPMPQFIIHLLEHYDWLIGLFILLVLLGIIFLAYRVGRWTLKEIHFSINTR